VANVDTVIVGGEIVKRGGRLEHRDLSRRLDELEKSSQRLWNKLSTDLVS
jgi:hypothetical protein